MKKTHLHLACLLALAGVTNSGSAFAENTEGFEFGGYFRQSALFSVENDLKDSDFIGQKETLGRLGLEYDNQRNIDLGYTWTYGDGRSLKIGVGISQGRSAGAGDGYIEIKGYTDTGTIFAGKRGYGKQRYIWMTDFFYTDMSGTGIGIESMKLGNAIVDFAYITSFRDDDYDLEDEPTNTNSENLNNIMHAVNFAAQTGAWDISATLKGMPDNWDRDGKEWAERGADLTLKYTLFNFLGMQGKNGSNTNFVLQGGIGLGAGQLLGGTITAYNAYAPGALRLGEHEDEWGVGNDGVSLISHVDDHDTSVRALIYGGHTFDNGVGIFPSIQAQYNDFHDVGDYEYWVSAMVRPVMPINDMMYLQGEIGYVYNNWAGDSFNQGKITIAPTLMFPTWTGVNPEVRFLASYVKNAWSSDTSKGQSKNDIIIGIQTEASW